MMFELKALVLELVKLHQACERLVEIQDFFACFVWQFVTSSPNVFGFLAQDHVECLDLRHRPHLLFLVLDDVI